MPLLNDDLSLWEIAHRWNNADPDKIHWFGLPLEVKDSFRLMMNAILSTELVSSLSMEKWHPGSDSPPESFIRYYIDDIYACIGGHKFNRKLFKSVGIERWYFQKWCEMYNIPLPEFWFPSGWKIEPDRIFADESEEIDDEADDLTNKDETNADKDSKLKANQKAKIACQQIAEYLWKEQPSINITDMVKHELIQKYGGGAHYENETIRRWIQVVAPAHIQGKRGRPKKD
jgi:hypothetical protein